MSAARRVRLRCTASPQVGEAIENLLWTGLYGPTRAAVIERLICEAVERKLQSGVLKQSDIQEPR